MTPSYSCPLAYKFGLFAAVIWLISMQGTRCVTRETKNPHHCSKRVGDIDPGVVVNLHTSHHLHHGLSGYSELINGLRAAASGAFVC